MKYLLLILVAASSAFLQCADTAKTEHSTQTEQSQNKKRTVYVSRKPKTKTYHATRKCDILNKRSRVIEVMSESKAEKKGYDPCESCAL